MYVVCTSFREAYDDYNKNLIWTYLGVALIKIDLTVTYNITCGSVGENMISTDCRLAQQLFLFGNETQVKNMQ